MRTPPQVLSCRKITGDADYLLPVVATSLDAYSDVVENVLRLMPCVAAIHFSLALRKV